MGDVEDALKVARTEAARTDLAADDPYLELMATHVAIGELLQSGPGGDPDGYSVACHDLVQRLIEIGEELRRRDEQQMTAWFARSEEDWG